MYVIPFCSHAMRALVAGGALMAAVKQLGPFPVGADNRTPDFKLKLPDGTGHLLRDALNVDVTAQGTAKTRAGYALAQAGNDCHSLWAPPDARRETRTDQVHHNHAIF